MISFSDPATEVFQKPWVTALVAMQILLSQFGLLEYGGLLLLFLGLLFTAHIDQRGVITRYLVYNGVHFSWAC